MSIPNLLSWYSNGVDYDDFTLNDHSGANPLVVTGVVTNESMGTYGSYWGLSTGDILTYTAPSSLASWTISLWSRPSADGTFINLYSGTTLIGYVSHGGSLYVINLGTSNMIHVAISVTETEGWLTITQTGRVVKIYWNGVEEASDTAHEDVPITSVKFYGKADTDYLYDEISFWDTALTEDYVKLTNREYTDVQMITPAAAALTLTTVDPTVSRGTPIPLHTRTVNLSLTAVV